MTVVETKVTHALGELADAVEAYGPLPFLCAVIRELHGYSDPDAAVEVNVIETFIKHFPHIFSKNVRNRSILEFYDSNPDRSHLPPTMCRKVLLEH